MGDWPLRRAVYPLASLGGQLQYRRCRTFGLVALCHQPSLRRIGLHDEPRAVVPDQRDEIVETAIEARLAARQPARASGAVDAARAAFPSGCLPMIGRRANTLVYV